MSTIGYSKSGSTTNFKSKNNSATEYRVVEQNGEQVYKDPKNNIIGKIDRNGRTVLKSGVILHQQPRPDLLLEHWKEERD